jgi:succinoglycan biosynthesis protein ExoO
MVVDSIPMTAQDQNVASDMSPPRVSVVMPVYNVAPYLERALESALGQSMPDLEVLVVDDGSTDATASIAETMAKRDQRVRLLRNEGNRGEPYTRMRAHAAARGEWIAPLDGDDAWLPNRLERLLSEKGAEQADAISDDLYRVEPDGQTAWRCLQHRWQDPLIVDTPRWLDTRDIVRHHLGVVQPLMRRSFLERHKLGVPNARVANDFYLYVEMLLAGARWLHVPGAYYIYYTTTGSVTASWSRYGLELLENHTHYAESSLVRAQPALRAEFLRFVMDERASLLVEQLRTDVKQQDFRAAAGHLLTQPVLLPRAARQTVRLWRVKRQRRRAAFRLEADAAHPGYARVVRR